MHMCILSGGQILMTFISTLEIYQDEYFINKYIFWDGDENNFLENCRKNASQKVLFPSTVSMPPSKSNLTDSAIISESSFHKKQRKKG